MQLTDMLFTCRLVHGDLPPLPTRRSSDLERFSASTMRSLCSGLTRAYTDTSADVRESASADSCSSSAPVVVRPSDRKSTRLNSSHLVISYAVFCLKKKNQQLYRNHKHRYH